MSNIEIENSNNSNNTIIDDTVIYNKNEKNKILVDSIVNELIDGIICCLKKDARYDLVECKEEKDQQQLQLEQPKNNDILFKTVHSNQDFQDKRIIYYREETENIHININNLSINKSKTTVIWQPRVLKQVKNDCCGYYSLFNGISIYKSINANMDGDRERYFQRMICRPLFWHIYSISLNLLINKARHSKKTYYPWNEKYILKGVMERCYIDYLLSNDNVISRQRYPITVLPDWSIESLKNNRVPLDEVNQLRNVSKKFKDNENYSHIFMIGVAVHWISMVVNKRGNYSEIIVLDSRNHDLMTGTDEYFQSLIDKHPEVPQAMKNGYLISLKDPKYIVRILQDCILGDKDIVREIIDINLKGFLDNYYTYVNPIESMSIHESLDLNDIKMVQLIHWLENYWPPSVIEHNICQVLDSIIKSKDDMTTIINKETLDSFSKWTKDLSSHCLHCSEINLLKRFSTTIEWFHLKFVQRFS